MEREILQVSKRTKSGTGNARRLRRSQMVPGVLYGKEIKSVSIEVATKPLQGLLSKIGEENVLIDVQVGEDKHTSLLKEVQRDPLTGAAVHIDFHRVSMKEEITVTISLVVKGAEDCPGVQEGGVVETLLNEVEVRCLPLDIPASFELDISELSMGEKVHVSDIKVPADVKMITSVEQTVITVSRPSEVEVEDATVGEPEVIGEEAAEDQAAEAKSEDGKQEGAVEKKEEPAADAKDDKKAGKK